MDAKLKKLHTKIFELHTGARPKAKDVMKVVDKYARQLCIEQKEICAGVYADIDRVGTTRNETILKIRKSPLATDK